MIAYVTLPTDIDRETYISYCLKTQSLSLETLSGGYYNRIPISSVNLNLIEFPEKVGEKGSQVVCIEEDNGQLIVITVLGKYNTIGDTVEGDMKFSKTSKIAHVESRGSLKSQTYTVMVKGDKNPSIILKVFNNRKLKGKLLLEVDGDIVTVANNSIDNTSFNSTTNTVHDITNDKRSIVKQTGSSVETLVEEVSYQEVTEFKINNGKEAMVLGNKFETFMNKLLDKIAAETVTTSLGQMPILNSAEFLDMKKEVKSLLSDIAKLE